MLLKTSRLRRNIILAEVLATEWELVVLEVGKNLLELEEETLARLVAVGIHVEGS